MVHTIPSLGDRPLSQHHFFADATVVLSEHTRARLADHGIGNVYRIFPPLDLARLQPVADGREASRRLGFGDRMLLYPGHFGEASGIQELLTALSRLPEDLADAQLVLACRAQRGQDWWEEARKLQDTARTLGVEDKVRILGPTVNIEELISACAVSVLVPRKLASKMDLPMAVLESLALGKPVIVGDSQPICEAALGGGLTVPFGDVDALAGAITSLLRDRELRAELAARGRAALVARAHPATAAARYQTIYERVLGRRALGRLQAAAVGEEVEN